ncbi:MAG: TrmH family RNA methyltransferase, partial [Actinomycetes bacterium]
NLTRSLQDFQNAGFSVVGLAADGDVTLAGLPEAVCTDKLVIVIGAEGTGLGRLVGETCDWRLSIPMAGGVESLNAAVAGSIVLQRVYSARA